MYVILISENIFLGRVAAAFTIGIRDLRRIRGYISFSVAKVIVTSFITSRRDYCNSLLYNIASKDILKPQCVQNCLARVVTQSPQFFHSVPLLYSLKLCTIAYQTLSSGNLCIYFSCCLHI